MFYLLVYLYFVLHGVCLSVKQSCNCLCSPTYRIGREVPGLDPVPAKLYQFNILHPEMISRAPTQHARRTVKGDNGFRKKIHFLPYLHLIDNLIGTYGVPVPVPG